MPETVGVRFKTAGKIYHFDPSGIEIEIGDRVVVKTARGLELGRVVTPLKETPASEIEEELKPVVRQAREEDIERAAELLQKGTEALEECRRVIANLNLAMKLRGAEYNLDGTRLTFFFTAEDRVDFRQLVRDLANKFQIKVELRQIGPRDEAKLIGGFGRCGLQLCCHNMLTEFDPVSIKMAKVQNLPLNPMKISGTCGRLLCCLTYEHQIYRELKAELPREGSSVTVAAGTGKVTATHPLKGTVTLMLENRAMVEVTAADINAPGAARPGAPPRAPAGAPVTGRPVRPPAEQKAPPGEVSATDQKATADGTATDSGAPRPERRRRRGGRGGGGRDNRPRGGPGRRSP